jgi:hypothetical protein
VSLDRDWLEPRVELIAEHALADVREIQRCVASGEAMGDLALRAPAVVALEAASRKGLARQRVLAELLAPRPRPIATPRVPVRDICGGMDLPDPF